MLGVPSDERFLALAAKRLGHLFPQLPELSAYHKRRLRLAATLEALIAEFARHSPGFYDDVALVDSTPVECARSVETTRRSQLADAADYGYCASHSRLFWGFRLHALFAIDGTPRALALTSPKIDEKAVCLQESLDALPGRGAADQGVRSHALLDLENRAVLATVDVHGHGSAALPACLPLHRTGMIRVTTRGRGNGCGPDPVRSTPA